jgi:hypothetical protein
MRSADDIHSFVATPASQDLLFFLNSLCLAKFMDFFIAGYPKCGTTSIYTYLKSHPAVFLPELKEPHFFTEDYPGVRKVINEEDYLGLYRAAMPGQLLGDASASVIHSEVALVRILARHPKAKFIVILRDPVAAVRSFHGELLHNLNEEVKDFEQVWKLQSIRKNGKKIPSTCNEPMLLQYAEIFSYCDHLPRFFNQVPSRQRLVMVFCRSSSKLSTAVRLFGAARRWTNSVSCC